MYRVTPIFENENLVASEFTDGSGICRRWRKRGIKFNVYVYNIQPDIIIDYKTGDNLEQKMTMKKRRRGHPAPEKCL